MSKIYVRFVVSFVLLFSCLNAAFPQVPNRKKLAVTDFKGETDERSFFLARTYTILSLRYADPVPCNTDRTKVKLSVQTANRLSDKSWIKADRIRTKSILAELLSHEQGHYDIGEIFAFDLKNKLLQTCFSKQNYKAEADAIVKEMTKKYDALQQQYDTETSNMQNTAAQGRWKKKIEALLSDETQSQ